MDDIQKSERAFAFTRRRAIAVVASSGVLVGSKVGATTLNARSGHQAVILIDSDDEKVMGHAISYSMNLTTAYARTSEAIRIEVVANGSGIKLFRADISPLQQPLATVRLSIPGIVFSMCNSSKLIAESREERTIELIPGARLVPFGIRRVIELEEQGWSYIHG
jgi:uncharacterized protein